MYKVKYLFGYIIASSFYDKYKLKNTTYIGVYNGFEMIGTANLHKTYTPIQDASTTASG